MSWVSLIVDRFDGLLESRLMQVKRWGAARPPDCADRGECLRAIGPLRGLCCSAALAGEGSDLEQNHLRVRRFT